MQGAAEEFGESVSGREGDELLPRQLGAACRVWLQFIAISEESRIEMQMRAAENQ